MQRLSLTGWILLAMAAGLAIGFGAPDFAKQLAVIATIFLRLIKSVIAPLLFGLLVPSVARAGRARELGRLGFTALVYFEIATSIALLAGWIAVMLARPGDGVALPAEAVKPASLTFSKILEQAFPVSIFDAMARGDVLEIVLFCFLLGLSCNAIGAKAEPVVRFAESIAAIAFGYTKYVMYLAPAAVCAALASTIAESGWTAILGLGKLVAAAWVTQVTYAILVFGGLLLWARAPLGRFYRAVREPMLIAFATTSSAAAVPQVLANMEQYGISKRVLGIVAPIGLSFNLAGSTIHLAMCAFFAAQAAGMALGIRETLMILLTLKLTSKGVAGIPRANFVVLSGLFAMYGLPMAALPMLLGVDALIDPVRTSVNVLGHCVAPVILDTRRDILVE